MLLAGIVLLVVGILITGLTTRATMPGLALIIFGAMLILLAMIGDAPIAYAALIVTADW
ncbi:MAG: hypothetical protein IT481_08650 [Gammaproteobacteria bacterium]|nr:hypothetical protein [Gammaproteobacteria bacterium]